MATYYNYILLGIVLMAVMVVYFRVALRFRIIDKPNERSSHVKPTIRGGGIIFPITVLLFTLLNDLQYPWLAVGVLLSGAVSFIDDIRDMPSMLRFGIHLLSAGMILYQGHILSMPVILMGLAFFFTVGVINAYNFMDGINGITGFYSLAILVPLMLTETNALTAELQYFVLVALLVFLFFNARKKAACFAGDVGSVTIAVIMCFMVTQRIIATDDYKYLCFLTLYMVDTGLTIIQRARMGEKIFEAHRRHLFQLFSNEMRVPHLLVAIGYGIVQFGLNMLLINIIPGIPGVILTFAVFILLYIIIKVRLLKVIAERP